MADKGEKENNRFEEMDVISEDEEDEEVVESPSTFPVAQPAVP